MQGLSDLLEDAQGTRAGPLSPDHWVARSKAVQCMSPGWVGGFEQSQRLAHLAPLHTVPALPRWAIPSPDHPTAQQQMCPAQS